MYHLILVFSLALTFANYRLPNKAAIITGGDSGIGGAAANMFAREGCTGITTSHLPEEHEDAQTAKKEIEGAGAQVNLVACNLMEEVNCRKLVESHMQKFGKLNILVNNASKQMCASPKCETGIHAC
jgi:NAD(P)-dependent dehydrogenase (short-subunit alcohol dehydrogenase family)